jgi:hypothetical protein
MKNFSLALISIVAAADDASIGFVPQYFRYNTHYDLVLDF